MKYGMENCVTEWGYTSGTAYRDPLTRSSLTSCSPTPVAASTSCPLSGPAS